MNAQSHGSFTELEVWKKARTLKKELMKLVRRSPAEEKYRLSDQILRASRSINSDLAEGHGRYTFKDQIHFCIQARGSVSETLNHLIDAYDCGYMTREELKEYK